MCGIAGVVLAPGKAVDKNRLIAMSQVVAHRGPDGSGYWIAPGGNVGLTHRRLSIIDLSPAGAQPMVSASGRYTVTYNGEIYNFPVLKKTLEADGVIFRGHSDTEVLLAAFERFGITDTLKRIDGMFAFAVWDEREQALTLARDRIGIKPLFYSAAQGELIFASELRPLVVWRGMLPAVSPQGLSEFLRLGYVPAPLSIFQNIFKLPPGHYAVYRQGTLSLPTAYWDYIAVARQGMAAPMADEASALAALENTLRASVARHMLSDVPLGAFLSGGIDSSTVVALMQEQSSRPVKTFSIGFTETDYNEAIHASAVARHLGTEHNELYITDADARAVIPQLPDIYDEPFADVSQIPTFLVSQLARRQVTVALSGDGGDELFAGYNRYVFVANFWGKLQKLPVGLRRMAAEIISSPGSDAWDRFSRVMPDSVRPAMLGHKIQKLAAILPSASVLALQTRLVSQWATPQAILSDRYKNDMEQDYLGADIHDLPAPIQQMLWDAKVYMVDGILTKVDRASMRVGLEARVPLLDHHVVELAWRIPLHMKLRHREGKWLLKQLLYKYVPKELVERPKMGFSVPIDNWLRGVLHHWADSYLAEKRLSTEGYFDANAVCHTWQEHSNGRVSRGGALWTVLMFQTWLEKAKKWV